MNRRRALAGAGKAATPERTPINELDALGALYFPELKSEVDLFVSICRKDRLAIAEFSGAVLKAGNDIQALAAANKNYDKWNPAALSLARDTLTSAARSLLERNRNLD